MGSGLCIFVLLSDEFGIRRVVQRDEGGLAQSLLAADNETAVLQLPEDSRGALWRLRWSLICACSTVLAVL